jgi:hypothetical protein
VRRRTKCGAFALLLITLLAAMSTAAEERADVSLSLGATTEPWTGEQTTLYLDLKTPALSFSNVFFDLPEVPGALMLRTDTTTIKLSEQRDGEAWQVLRYPIALFPQQAGSLTVPVFEVRFETSAGFGSEPASHVLQTQSVMLTVRQPPGLDPGSVVVTTPNYTLTSEWTVPPEPIRAGDAVTLTVERRATGLSAMLLPALPVFDTEGLAAYPAAPEVRDQTNRGSLVGERTDRITWIIENAGDYALPAVAFRWWDPGREALRTLRVEGVTFIAAAASGQAQPSAAARKTGPERSFTPSGMQLALGIAAGLLLVAGVRYRRRLGALGIAMRRRILPPPRALLKALNPRSRP